MNKKSVVIIILAVFIAAFIGSCKKTHFQLTEEVHDSQTFRFTLKEAYYRMGHSIAITGGRFELTPADSIVLYIEGQGKVFGYGEKGVVGLDFAQTARFYITLPVRLSPGKYDTRQKAICEITGSLAYGQGENLFVCQSGRVVIDSLIGTDIYGNFKGKYVNTSNKFVYGDGPFKANLKR